MITQNVEGLADWDIRPDWHAGRVPGVAAFVRVRHEAQWIVPALNSIAWCDEIVIALQGHQEDGTDALVWDWAAGRDNVRVMAYPFLSLPNGPGHDAQVRGSVHERAYFYNWTLAHTTRSHALKWDGDMVALDEAEGVIRGVLDDVEILRFPGVDIVGDAGDPHHLHVGARRLCASEPRLFRVGPRTFYESGPCCEVFSQAGAPASGLSGPLYLHFKWAKDPASATKAWPVGWESLAHFQAIGARARPVADYNGPVPRVLHG